MAFYNAQYNEDYATSTSPYDIDIINQLITFGFGPKSKIMKAMECVVDSNDINQILDYLQKHTTSISITEQKSATNTLNDGNKYTHKWQEIEGKIDNKMDHFEPGHALIEEKKDNKTEAIKIMILQNTEQKCVFKITKDIDSNPINDDDFNELITFIQHKFEIQSEMGRLYEKDEKEIFIEDADDLQTALEAMDDTSNELHLCLENNAKCCVVMIGITGSGKSTLIKLLSGNKNIATSATVDSCTESLLLVQSEYNHRLYYLDTIGTNDSKRTSTDQQILKMAFKHLYDNEIDNIKIIWTVKGDTEKKEAQFSLQAEFINNLTVNNESPWKSCLIVKKNGGANDDNIDGVIAAAIDHGAKNANFNATNNVFGFKCVDWKNYTEAQYIPSYKLKECGYFKENEAMKTIQHKLSSLPSFKLLFKNEKCIKCGIHGDPRYIDANCHTEKRLFHDAAMSFKHVGQIKLYHQSKIASKQSVAYTHTGHQQKKHSGSIERYHSGELRISKKLIAKQHGWMALAGIVSVATLGLGAPVSAVVVGAGLVDGATDIASGKAERYTCCNKYICDATPCAAKWKCCQQHESVIECTLSTAAKVWSCCKKVISGTGCTAVNKNVNVWKCCRQQLSSNGCKQKWDCCDGTGEGCKAYYPCCGGDNGSIGCRDKCSNCKMKWGNGPGCFGNQ